MSTATKNLLMSPYCHTARGVKKAWQKKIPLFIAVLPNCQAPYKDIYVAVAVPVAGKKVGAGIARVPAIQDEHEPVKKGDGAKGGTSLTPGLFPFPLFGATGVHGALQHTSRVNPSPGSPGAQHAATSARQGADPRARRGKLRGATLAAHRKECGAYNSVSGSRMAISVVVSNTYKNTPRSSCRPVDEGAD